ncbi:ATP-binding protein [Jeotgalibacillus marinus]|uniref:histidine kinase n=1 Tax=Jeotgalibacillus marinus TaxID=86667 RepID=A0ABV3Q1E5_9BACL
MKVLIGLLILLFFIQDALVFSGIGWLPRQIYIGAEIIVSLLIVMVGFTMFRRYRKEQQLFIEMKEEEVKMTALFQSMPDFVCFKDGEGRWIRMNDFGLALYELENETYIGKTDRDLGLKNPFFKEAFEGCLESDEETWKKAETIRVEEEFYVPSGELKTFDVIKVPMFYKDGSRKALIIIGRDISQQKIVEERLVKQEKLSVSGELAAGIAHEIKNPLTSLKGFVQLMREQPHLSTKNVEIMASEIDRVHSIVEELLVLSKPHKRVQKCFSLQEAMDYVVNVMKHQALLSRVEIIVERSSTESDHVLGDRNKLIQVMINLVKNAIEAMEDGGEMKIRSVKKNEEVWIQIQDEGVGISTEQLNNLAKPFYTTKVKGMGLGLTICNKIIHEHNGQLTIQSELGKGTIVTVKMPIHKLKFE